MRALKLLSSIAVCFSTSVYSCFAQVDSAGFVKSTSNVHELLDLADLNDRGEATTVATQIELPVRETPSIVSVIMEEDIARSGARDLRELLSMVPGIDFESDVQNISGMGIRGLWGHEGKVLILWDGHTLNETAYGTFSFMQHIFLSNIKRIEIIRGPGSAIYGGMAGLGVINIISKNYAESSGGRFSQSVGVSQGKLSRQTTQLGLGKRWDNGITLSATGTLSVANLSNRKLADTLNYADSSAINTNQIAVQAGYKNLNASLLYDDYKIDDVEGSGRSVFTGLYGQINYQYRITEKFSLLPAFSFKSQQPWNLERVNGAIGTSANLSNARQVGGIKLLYEPNEKFSLVSGTEYTHDHSEYNSRTRFFSNGMNTIEFRNVALFSQAIFQTSWAILTAGARIDIHNYFGSAFVPRIGLTRAWKKWHAKLLYSNAFKAPTITNLTVNKYIRPERLSSSELEVGYQTTEMLSFTGNLFYTKLKSPILYFSPDGITDNYQNGAGTGTYGFEVTSSLKRPWGRVQANYSFYHSANNKVDYFEAQGHRALLLGFPAHKVVVQGHVNISEFISGTLSVVGQSKKYYVDPLWRYASKPAVAQVNVILHQARLIYPGLNVSAGVYNVLNQKTWMVQPYADNKAAIPGMGREYSLSLTYQIRQ